MKKEFEDVISEHLGIGPVKIESSDFSAQKRTRLYWTNISISEYTDKGIVLSDIIEHGLVDRDKSYCIDANYFKGTNLEQYLTKKKGQVVFDKPIQLSHSKECGGKQPSIQNRIYSEKGKSPALTSSFASRIAVVFEKPHGFIKGGFSDKEKFSTIRPASKDNYAILYSLQFRKLSVLECKRLQTVPDDYKMNVSNSQAYKMLGNGWTVDVIAHIFKNILNG